jgi:sterol desaturase/sphingolipid hydroxylase (fatty acid hydroxylase superfamily)
MDGEGWIRLVSFCGVLLLVALAEQTRPRRPLTVARRPRWFANLTIVIIDNLFARLLLPLLPVGMSGIAAVKGWGILNQVGVPFWFAIPAAVMSLDLAIYLQHRAFHRWGIFWRFHRMHHTDLDLDVTSGVRFHPLEILVSLLIKMGVIVIIGAPPLSVIIFEVLLNATSLFSHGNLRLPTAGDRWLRLLLVTPDMHRVHHSVIPGETNSNYGFNVPWWDRIFGTYRAQPRDGHDGMTIGLKEYRNPLKLGLWGLLLVPFRKPYG